MQPIDRKSSRYRFHAVQLVEISTKLLTGVSTCFVEAKGGVRVKRQFQNDLKAGDTRTDLMARHVGREDGSSCVMSLS